MEVLVPLTVAVPLLGAAVLMGLSPFYSGSAVPVLGLLTAAATTAIAAVLLVSLDADRTPIVYWFAGYEPRDGQPVGIAFVVEALPAAAATFAGLLVTVALLFSWRHFGSVGAPFPALMLVFLAAMTGFVLSGDLFNMFVFFELMTVVAIALTAYRPDQTGPLAGSLSFAVVNSVGALLLLTGIALVYGRTGALNLAEIGQELSGEEVDGTVVVSFALIATGFLTKAAVVPFHFWMGDTYAVAPAPVCLLFTAIMSELGLYGLARVLWVGYAGAFEPALPSLQVVLVVLGAATALVGAVMCLAQHHLKRLLAFATIAYVGLFLIGVGLLTDKGLGGTLIFVLADGLVKGGLFVAVGALQQRFDTVDEIDLHGRGRAWRFGGAVFVLGALGLAALPPFGPFLGKALIEESAVHEGFHWVPALMLVTEAIVAAAVLRAAARIFLGWGPARAPGGDERRSDDDTADVAEGEEEAGQDRDRVPVTMAATAAGLVVAGMAAGFIPDLAEAATLAARQLIEGADYLPGSAPPVRTFGTLGAVGPHLRDYLYAAGSVAGAFLVAGLALRRPDAGRPWLRRPVAVGRMGLAGLRSLHSGHTGEYVGWLTVGAAALTGVLGVTLT